MSIRVHSRLFATKSLALLVALAPAAPAASAADTQAKFYPDDPIEVMPSPLPVKTAMRRRLNDYYDFFLNTFGKPGEQRIEVKAPIPARAVNTLGEAPDSEWYTRRHYFHPLTTSELVRGPGDGAPPSAEGHWTVIDAKTEGVTPGFTIADSTGRRYIIKFDPKSYAELATAADVISSKFFHALGYNVPQNQIVFFEPAQLQIGENTLVEDKTGRKRKMTSKDLADILLNAHRGKDGKHRAVASLYLSGQPLGPFRFHGTRRDDPNDTVPHEHRRDLRGFRVFCSWLGHDDSRSINTLDMLVNEKGSQFVKHYLIDFGSTLGSASYGPNSARSGNEYLFSWKPLAKEFFTLGLYVPRWGRADFPNFRSVGRFESAVFDAENWVPEYPNAAFVNQLPDDAFWAARQVMAFTDDQIQAIVRTGQFSDPRAEDWVVKCLIERRDKIGQAFFKKVLPLDRFTIENRELKFEDLAVKHGLSKPRQYEIQWSEFNNQSGATKLLPDALSFQLPRTTTDYLKASIRGGQQTVDVYVRQEPGGPRVVGLARTW